jgi:hypothetical protein
MTTITLSEPPAITQAFGGEVLQPTALDAFEWPERDPRQVEQPSRVRAIKDDALAQALAEPELDTALLLERSAALPPARQILGLLAHAVFNFNGVTRVKDEAEWLLRIERRLAKGEPIEVVYPWGCKIGNAAKLFDAHGPTCAELVSLRFMARAMSEVGRIYPPGATLHLITDTVFYNTALGNPPPEVAAYRDALVAWTRLPGIAGFVHVHDYAELLAPHAAEYCARYTELYVRMDRDRDCMVDSDTWQRLFRSTRAVINTRHLGFDYDALKAVFGPSPNPLDPRVQRVDAMAREALKVQLVTKAAADGMGFLDRWRPDHIRASCHKGLKHGRAVLGLRPYGEYYRSAKLLPYHGAALVTEHKGHPRMVVLPEILLRGRADLLRVTDADGRTWCYLG